MQPETEDERKAWAALGRHFRRAVMDAWSTARESQPAPESTRDPEQPEPRQA